MTANDDTPKRKRQLIRTAGVILTLCVAAAGGCATPLQTSPTEAAFGSYSDALITRAIMDNSFEIPVRDTTANNGIREMQRVEQLAPDGSHIGALVPINTIPASAQDSQPATPSTLQSPTTTHPESFGQGEPVRPLTLQDTIARAMKHSLAIQVEAYNPAIKETLIVQAQGIFDPVFFGSTNWTNQNEPQLQALSNTNGQTWANQIGMKQLLPSGGTAQATFGDTYRDFVDGSNFSFDPSHQVAAGIQLTQPLLRGFGENVTRANIYLAQRDKKIALSTFRRQVIDTVSKVEDGYHLLWQAQEALVIQEDLLEKTWDSYDRTVKRTGDTTQITIKQAEAAYLQRKAELVRARASVRTQSDNLKVLLNDPDISIRSNQLIVASDRGIEVPVLFSQDEQVSTALRQRGELQEARLQIERADIVINESRNELLPKVDLTASIQANGLETGFDEAFGNTLDPQASNIDYILGLKFEIPLGYTQAQGALRQHQLERRQAIVQMLNIAEQIIGDTKKATRDVLTSYQELVIRADAETAAGTALNALTLSEPARPKLDPEFLQLKLDAQQRLANARLDRLQAIVNYNEAILHLEQAKGTLLEYDHIAIGPSPKEDDTNKGRFYDHTFDMGK